jgi:hypothetical protein
MGNPLPGDVQERGLLETSKARPTSTLYERFWGVPQPPLSWTSLGRGVVVALQIFTRSDAA